MSGTTPNIILDNGKYVIVLEDDGTIAKFLRYGEDWPAANDMAFSKMFVSLVHAYIELRDRNENEAAPRDDGTVRKAHYGAGRQPWDDIVDAGWAPEFAAGNVLKYLRRNKDQEHSLAAARWYYTRLIEMSGRSTPIGAIARRINNQLLGLLLVGEVAILKGYSAP